MIEIDGDRIELFRVGPWQGFEIFADGEVVLIEDGVRRKATRGEALKLRANVRWALGESIADVAGLEPE